MKYLVVFASFLVAAAAITDEQAWAEFKQNCSKQYRSLREEKLRYEIFKTSLEIIKEHNVRYENGESSYNLGINQFADLTAEEFKQKYLNYKPLKINFTDTFEVPEGFNLPESVDWREKAVLSVKDQGDCGSCWVFSAIGAVEGQNAIKYNTRIDLSEQEILDCYGASDGDTCNGGSMQNAFYYIKDNGISADSSYPYIAIQQKRCLNTKTPRVSVKVTGYKDVRAIENALQAAVAAVGPISIGIVGEPLQLYKSGVLDYENCGDQLDHGVLAVGYGTTNNQEYWLVKNSWGKSWGEEGFIRMSRNKLNQCGIATDASFPVIA